MTIIISFALYFTKRRAKGVEMVFELNEPITAGRGMVDLNVSIDRTAIDVAHADISLTSDPHFNGSVGREPERISIKGKLTVEYRVNCSRCAEPQSRHLERDVRAVYSAAADDQAERELSDDDLDEDLLPDGGVLLPDVIREQILLSLPEQDLCGDDCKGLCTQCGANQNLIDCNCSSSDVDPRWAALKGLRS